MTMRKRFGWAMLLAVALLAPAAGTKGGENESLGFDQAPKPRLTIGSVAPPLDIEHWLQTGKGAFGPVTTFEADHVYVVEFWATWCGPCVASMPHLAKLQQKYADKQVQIISITAEEPATVEPFLDRKVRGDDTQTYRALTSAYCLTSDPDRSCNDAYMKAAGERGIPTAFIVGKDGHIEWIGHPMTMDDPLASIVDSTWDRKTFLAEFQQKKTIERIWNAAMRGEGDQATARIRVAINQLEVIAEDTTSENVRKGARQAIGSLKQHSLLATLKSTDADLADFKSTLDEANVQELLNTLSRIWRMLKKFEIARHDEVLALSLNCLEERLDGKPSDIGIAQLYVYMLDDSATKDMATERIQTVMKNYS